MTGRRPSRGLATVRVVNDRTSEAEGTQVITILQELGIPFMRAPLGRCWQFPGRYTDELLARLEARQVQVQVTL